MVLTPAGTRPGWRPRFSTTTSWRSRRSARTRCRLMNSVPVDGADDVRQRRPEPCGALDGVGALEVHACAALVRLIRGIEDDEDAAHVRPLAHREDLAATLVAQSRAHEIEALRVRLAEIAEGGLVARDLDRRVGNRFALRILDVAEHGEAVIHLVLGDGGDDGKGDRDEPRGQQTARATHAGWPRSNSPSATPRARSGTRRV